MTKSLAFPILLCSRYRIREPSYTWLALCEWKCKYECPGTTGRSIAEGTAQYCSHRWFCTWKYQCGTDIQAIWNVVHRYIRANLDRGLGTLLAGVVGVSNIIMVTVRERTKEIGVRRAIGAKPASIIFQIIKESTVLTVAAVFWALPSGFWSLIWQINSCFRTWPVKCFSKIRKSILP